jgi:hypothetical protein
VFLTKPDLFLAIAAATLAALAMAYLSRSNNGKGRFSIQLLVLVAGALVPSAVFMAYYAQVWQAREGLRAVTAAWLPVLTTSASDNNFYRWCMGLDAPGANLLGIIKYTGGFVACVSFLALCAQRSHRNKAVATGFGALLLGLLYLAYARFDWMMCGRVFGPVTLSGCGFLAWRWWRKRAEPGGNGLAFPVLWSVFALFLLAKMALAARIWQYGFYLGMPAAVLIVFLLLWTLPAELERYGLNRKMFRLLNTIFILAGLLRLATVSQYLLGQKSLPVGTGGDRLITEGPQLKPDGFGVKLALAWLKENTAPANTLAVLPEGVMVNYLSRHANPTPYTVFCLPEVRAYGESNMLYALKEAGPDYVLLIHRDASEYGVNFFGLEPGYGHDIMNWVHDNYSSLWIYGHEPLKTNAFGIQMLVRHVPAVRPRNESKPDAGALTPVPAAETPEQVR